MKDFKCINNMGLIEENLTQLDFEPTLINKTLIKIK